MNNKKIIPYILVLPSMFLIIGLLIYPLVQAGVNSFFDISCISPTQGNFIGIANYKNLFFYDSLFWKSLKHTIIWTLGTVGIQVLIGIVVALLLNSLVFMRRFFRTLVLIPYIVPPVIAALTWKWMYSVNFGIINNSLLQLKLINENIEWLGNPSIALTSVMLVFGWRGISFVAIATLAGLQSVSRNLYEAASLDGAGVFTKFWYVTIPSIRKILIIVITLSTLWALGHFDIVYIMTAGGPAHATELLSTYLYSVAFSMNNLGYSAAISVCMLILALPLGILLLIYLGRKEI